MGDNRTTTLGIRLFYNLDQSICVCMCVVQTGMIIFSDEIDQGEENLQVKHDVGCSTYYEAHRFCLTQEVYKYLRREYILHL